MTREEAIAQIHEQVNTLGFRAGAMKRAVEALGTFPAPIIHRRSGEDLARRAREYIDRTHPLSSALAELRRASSFSSVRLRGLGAEDVHTMLERIAQRAVPWTVAEQVHRQTEGHPLFVQEVMRYLVEEGVLARDEDGRLQRQGETPLVSQIPEGLRDVIGKRISRLSADCNRVLSVAAVIGRDFDFETLTVVAALPEESLLAALEEAVRIGVLQEQTAAGRCPLPLRPRLLPPDVVRGADSPRGGCGCTRKSPAPSRPSTPAASTTTPPSWRSTSRTRPTPPTSRRRCSTPSAPRSVPSRCSTTARHRD